MLARAIKEINPTAYFTIDGDTIDGITWLEGTTPISEAEITAEVTRLQTEYDNAQYSRDRASAYPSLTDQADMQYWDSVNGTTTWADAIAAVKAEFPKP